MIDSFTVTNQLGESLEVILREPEKSGLYVESIEGLGPVKASINTTDLASADGALFNSARLSTRNIVITLGMLFDPTVEDSRQKAYRFFPVKSKVTLRFNTDRRTVTTVGYVESNDPNIFSKDETTQISIICPDPFFYAVTRSLASFYDAAPMFEFPFENDSLTEAKLIFGEIRQDARVIVNYQGDVDVGVLIRIHATGTATGIVIYNVRTGGKIEIDTDKLKSITGAAFKAGEDILISTVRGKKYVRLLRNGEYTNIIGVIGKNTDWLQLSPGDNLFAYSAKTGQNDLMIDFTYYNAYGGI